MVTNWKLQARSIQIIGAYDKQLLKFVLWVVEDWISIGTKNVKCLKTINQSYAVHLNFRFE